MKLEITTAGDQVTIKVAYETPNDEKATYLVEGLTKGEFTETFTLPTDVAGENAKAEYDRGILTMTLPKAEYVKPKTIKVNATK